MIFYNNFNLEYCHVLVMQDQRLFNDVWIDNNENMILLCQSYMFNTTVNDRVLEYTEKTGLKHVLFHMNRKIKARDTHFQGCVYGAPAQFQRTHAPPFPFPLDSTNSTNGLDFSSVKG
jgi:hypothetical protein